MISSSSLFKDYWSGNLKKEPDQSKLLKIPGLLEVCQKKWRKYMLPSIKVERLNIPSLKARTKRRKIQKVKVRAKVNQKANKRANRKQMKRKNQIAKKGVSQKVYRNTLQKKKGKVVTIRYLMKSIFTPTTLLKSTLFLKPNWKACSNEYLPLINFSIMSKNSYNNFRIVNM